MTPHPTLRNAALGRSRPDPRGEILFITDRRFWRRSIGSEQRIAGLVRYLARRGERICVVYLGRATGREGRCLEDFLSSAPGLEVLTRPGDSRLAVHAVQRFVRRAIPWRRSARKSADDAGPLPFDVSPLRREFVQRIIEERSPRVVVVEFLRLTGAVPPHGDAGARSREPRYWIDTHDLLHRRAARYRAAGATVTHDIGAEEEIRTLGTYDAILAIQKPEADRFRELLPEKPVIVVPHGLEMPRLSDRNDLDARPRRIGFLGGRDESNRHALDWFVREVWPGLRSRFGRNVELHVAGQVCRAWKTRREGLVVLGPIDSINLFWPEIDIAINPVRFGSGLKIKNVEALAYGRPLITTSIGAEGLEAASPGGLRIADSVIEWHRCLDEWLSDPTAADAVGSAGRTHAETHLSEEAAFRELDFLLAETSAESVR